MYLHKFRCHTLDPTWNKKWMTLSLSPGLRSILALALSFFWTLPVLAQTDTRPTPPTKENKATPSRTTPPTPRKPEPAKPKPRKAEPRKAEPAKAEPAKAEPAKAEPRPEVRSFGAVKARPVGPSQIKVIHKAPDAITPGVSYTMSFRIEENEELEEVYLRYRRQGDSSFRRAPSQLSSGTIYRVTLKGFQVREPAIEYYLEGQTSAGKSIFLLGSPTSPKVVKVEIQDAVPTPKVSTRKKRQRDAILGTGTRSDTVISTSRTEERLQTAPGIVSVITGAEIQAAGWRRLVDILRYMVGIDVNDNHFGGEIGGRGIISTFTYSDKVVILVDGHNYIVRNSNRNFVSSALVSVDNIARIEVVRGPGSALWGSSAISGVINIITKTAQGFEGIQGTFGGSPRSRSFFLNLQAGQKILNSITFSASFSLQQEFHQFLRAPVYEFQKLTGQSFHPVSEEYGQNFVASLTWKGLTLRVRQMRYKPLFTLYTTTQSIITDQTQDRVAAKLTYSTLVGSWGALSTWVGVDHFSYNPNSTQIQNAYSPYFSNPRLQGASNNVNVFRKNAQGTLVPDRAYPMCQEVTANFPGPCVKFTLGADGARRCSIVEGPQAGAKEIESLPYSASPAQGECRNGWLGQTTLTEGSSETRFEAGLQLSATFGGFNLNVGLEVEASLFESPFIVEYAPLSPQDGTRRIVSDTIFHGSAFVQAQYKFNRVFQLTAGARIDADSFYPASNPVVVTPRAALVISPGAGFYIKALYGNAFKAPAHFNRYTFRSRDALLFGNPDLNPEQVHSADLQVNWFWKRKVRLSLGGYFAYYNNLVTLSIRAPNAEFLGKDTWINYFERQFGDPTKVDPARTAGNAALPSGARPYVQPINRGEAYAYGGEFSMQLTPIRGLNIRGSFGLHMGQSTDPNDTTGTKPLLPYLPESSSWKATLIAAYQFPMGPVYGSLVVGALVGGSKRVNPQASQIAFAVMTGETTRDSKGNPIATATPFPRWDVATDPSLETPLSIHTFATFQVLRIFGAVDAGVRVTNFINYANYDAETVIFLGQTMIDVNLWLRVHL